MSSYPRHLSAALLLILFITFLLLGATNPVAAGALMLSQDPTPTPAPPDDGSAWSEPVNLSNSAIADNPHLVLPTQGNTESGTTVLWQEAGVPGMVYASHDGQQWSSPQSTELPFATGAYYPELSPEEMPPVFSPTLLHDETNQRLHAIWIDENSALWYSQVDAAAVDDFPTVTLNAWTQRIQLAENAIGLSAAIGPGPADDAASLTGEAPKAVHISYMRQSNTEEEPAGIYYLQFDVDAGASQATTTLLYPTRYTMALAPNDAQTQLVLHPTTAQTTGVLVSWELGPLQKIFLARSTDGGQTWDDAAVIDERTPDDSPGATAPTNIHLAGDGDALFALWQAGHHDAPCTQYYDWSDDGGQTWQGPQPMLQSFVSCPSHVQLLTYPDADPILLTVIDGQPYLQAWRARTADTGAENLAATWSEPQPQETLASFTNPDTFQPVTLGCLQAGRPQAQSIIVVGCQQDDSKDIWAMQRTVEDLDDWFAVSPWHTPVAVFDQNRQTNGLQLLTTAGPAEGLAAHAFWNEPAQQAITYARWDGADCTDVSDTCSWSRPLDLVSASQGLIGSPAVAVASDALLLTWHTNDGAIYFSRASSNQTLSAADWSTPHALPVPSGAHALQPAIAHIRGTIVVAYAVPFNEQRGLYLTTSQDMGETWSPPRAILDGAEAGWHIVGDPRLVLDGETGQMHLLVAEQTIGVRGAVQTLALHYIRSQGQASNGEPSFTAPHQLFAGPASWYQIHLRSGQRTGSDTDSQAVQTTAVHILWQEAAAHSSQTLNVTNDHATATLWSRHSPDAGQTWDLAQRILVPPGVTTSVDDRETIHLLHATSDALRHWYWDGAGWQESARLQWQHSPIAAAYLPATIGAAFFAGARAEEPTPSAEGRPSAGLLILYDPPGQDAEQGPQFTLRPNVDLSTGARAATGSESQTASAATRPATDATPLAAPENTNTENAAATPQTSVAQAGSADPALTIGVAQAVRQTAADPLAIILLAIIPAGFLVIVAGIVKVGLSRRRRG